MTDLTLPIHLDPDSAPDETRYVTASGLPVRIYATDGGGSHPIHGAIWRNGTWDQLSWRADGRIYSDGRLSEYNLRDRAPTKRGVWVAQMQGHCERFYYEADDKCALEKKARSWGFEILRIGYLEDCTGDTPADPPLWVDWAKLPDWAKWAAADEDGAAWGYDKKPTEGNNTWHAGTSCKCAEMESPLYRLASGFDWRKTLTQRPEDV